MLPNSGKSQINAPTAPHPDDFQVNHPPPSYEECTKTNGIGPRPQQYSNLLQQQITIPQTQIFTAPALTPLLSVYRNPHEMQKQNFFYNDPSLQPRDSGSSVNVLYLAKGAKVRTTASGAISIPPPPPGCPPTQGQIAAMCGQPVVVKKKKKSFF